MVPMLTVCLEHLSIDNYHRISCQISYVIPDLYTRTAWPSLLPGQRDCNEFVMLTSQLGGYKSLLLASCERSRPYHPSALRGPCKVLSFSDKPVQIHIFQVSLVRT